MKLGIIGVGHLAGTLLAGLTRRGRDGVAMDPGAILLSPRGQGPELAARAGFGLAADNAELVRACDLVLLAVRPAAAEAAVRDLPWRAGQVLVSACAGVGIGRLAPLVAPARVARIMPVTAAAIGKSPTLLHPDLPQVAALLHALGPVIAIGSEPEFEVATVSAAVYGWAQVLVRQTAHWSEAQGLPAATARALVARTFEAAGALIAESPQEMDEMLHELVTPGGITERGLQVLTTGGLPPVWDAACAAVLTRLRGQD